MKVIVIGAGPAGISCAYELTKLGVDVEVFEASNHVGGMARTIELWGQLVDLGPHRFFSKEKHVNLFFKELTGSNYVMINRLTRIYYNNRFFNYPIKLFNILTNLHIFTVIRIMYDYFKQKLFPIKKTKTFEEWVTDRFGKRLFKIFFKSYSEKLWGVPCSEIDADWAAQRIKTLSLWGAVISALKGNKGNKHKTLVDQFAYPKQGSGTIYTNAQEYICQNGGKIHLNTQVKKVLLDGNTSKGIELIDGTIIEADIVVSTMPITNMTKGLKNIPENVKKACDKLLYRNTILCYLEIDAVNLFKDNWIYVHSPNVTHGRITNFRNWSPELFRDKKTSIICMEFWAFDTDSFWKENDEKISEIAKKEIFKLELIAPNTKILNTYIHRVPKCYPVYKIGYNKHLKVIENYLDSIKNLLPIGRYGAFKYNNQDHSILMGMLAAEKITKKSNINLWEINTDTEYQEEKKIKDVFTQ